MDQPATGSPSKGLAAYLAENDFFRTFDASSLADLEAELELVRLSGGETLFRQGDRGDSMYVLIRGLLHVRISNPDGSEAVIDVLDPGATVGEMALVTGQTRTATVYTVSGAELVKFSKAGFDRLAAKYPQVMAGFAETVVPRWRRVQLADALTNVFGKLDIAALQDLQDQLEWLHLSNGDVLFRQGEPADALYIVVNGRLRIVVNNPDGSERGMDEVSRGETVGELGSLTEETRSATVYAIRDTDVVKLSEALFEHLVERYPQAMIQIARLIIRRSQRAVRASSLDSATAATFAIVPISGAVPLSAFARRLAETLVPGGPTLHLSSEQFDRAYGKAGSAQIEEDHPTNVAIVGWLSEQETKHRYVVYETDTAWSPWTQRCLRQADRILLVGQAGADPAQGEIEAAMRRTEATARTELVLLQPERSGRPAGTQRWLQQRRVHTHHHIRMHADSDFQRLSRSLTGRAVGLVLSGGGARGFAQIGVIRAIEEAGLEIDIVGGTSIGALVGAAYVMGLGYAGLHKLAQTFASPKQLLDRTLPYASFLASAKVTGLYRKLFDDVQIEDLWRPYFCVSSNLTRAEAVVHRTGPLWESVRASTAIPGIFAPFLHDGDVLVDGRVMNHFPVDVMRDGYKSGVVIAVNTSPRIEKLTNYRFGPSISGWQVLWSRLNPLAPRMHVPSIFSTLMRATEINSVHRSQYLEGLADVLIQPAVESFRTLDFARYEEIIDVGYRAAQPHIEAWKNSTSGRAT